MMRNASFQRKVVYGAIIVGLLIPLFLLGQPASRRGGGGERSGGVLPQLRTSYGLSQADLGRIDPASETMKMATLGLRGVASNLLWYKVNEFKMKESWDKLAATLNQLKKLQPNQISVWEYQAHNLSYNISSEFDDYKMRYYWVKRGIEFLMEGTQYNARSPRLFWNLGWFCGQKIGRADEFRQFRRLYRKDSDFHEEMVPFVDIDAARGPDGLPDNWLTGYLWYRKAEAVVDQGVPVTWLRENPDQEGLTEKRRSAVIFYSDAPKSLINFAMALTDEVVPGEKTRAEWKRGGEAWAGYGNIDLPTTYGHTVRLNQLGVIDKEIKEIRARLEEMSPGLRAKMRDARLAKLPPEQRQAMNTPLEKLDPQGYELARQGFQKAAVTDTELAEAMPEGSRTRAIQLAQHADEKRTLYDRTKAYRDMINYGYWAERCDIEQTQTLTDARRLMLEADERAKVPDPEGAKQKYEEAWKLWQDVFTQHPDLVNDAMALDLQEVVIRYMGVLEQLDERLPEDFPLHWMIEKESFRELEHELKQHAAAAGLKLPESDTHAPSTQKPTESKPPAGTKPADQPGTPTPAPATPKS